MSMKINCKLWINENTPVIADENELYHLFWPIYSYDDYGDGIVKTDMSTFPSDEEIAVSYHIAKEWRSIQESGNPKLLLKSRQVHGTAKEAEEEFWQNLGDCRVAYIIDKKFSIIEYNLMLSLFEGQKTNSMLTEVHIICRQYYKDIRDENEKRQKTIAFSITVDAIPDNPLYEIHDRFAVLDDEIWHFGGTVGGINPQLTAYSRGWKDSDGRFRKYIKSMMGQK